MSPEPIKDNPQETDNQQTEDVKPEDQLNKEDLDQVTGGAYEFYVPNPVSKPSLPNVNTTPNVQGPSVKPS